MPLISPHSCSFFPNVILVKIAFLLNIVLDYRLRSLVLSLNFLVSLCWFSSFYIGIFLYLDKLFTYIVTPRIKCLPCLLFGRSTFIFSLGWLKAVLIWMHVANNSRVFLCWLVHIVLCEFCNRMVDVFITTNPFFNWSYTRGYC